MSENKEEEQVDPKAHTLTWHNYSLTEEFVDALGIIDNELKVVQCSQRWQELLGLSPQELKGRSFLDFSNDNDRAELQHQLKVCLREDTNFDLELRLDHTDGQHRWVQLRAIPMSERKLIFINVFNITPLKNKIGQLDSFFTLSPDLFCILDFKGYFIRFNPAWQLLLGWNSDRLRTDRLISFVHPDDQERTKVQYANSLEGADTILFENRLRTVNGTYRWVEWKSVTLVEETIVFAIARDITSRKLYQAKQRDLEVEKATSEAKSLFLAAMSHELKTPLNGIIGSADLAYDEADNPALLELLTTLKESAESLRKVVNDILDYTAMDAGEIEFDPQPFSLKSLITNLENSFRPPANKKGLSLNSEFDLSLPDLVVSDAHRITQVLHNLVDNAVRFTEDGDVVIKVQPSDPSVNYYSQYTKPQKSDEGRVWVRISVKDTGIGISMRQQLQIFDVFSQAADFIKRKRGGLGIGLTVSKHLVELLGGQLEVYSKLDKGSEFSFDIPFTISHTVEKDLPEDDLSDEPISPMKILLVEDNVINQKIVVRYLSNHGHSVMVAENGHLGLEAFEGNIFDVILMDLQMPEMDGLTATRCIRELEEGGERRTPIIAMTAHAAKSDEEACYDSGMDHFIVKPFRPIKLDYILRKVAKSISHLQNNQ